MLAAPQYSIVLSTKGNVQKVRCHFLLTWLALNIRVKDKQLLMILIKKTVKIWFIIPVWIIQWSLCQIARCSFRSKTDQQLSQNLLGLRRFKFHQTPLSPGLIFPSDCAYHVLCSCVVSTSSIGSAPQTRMSYFRPPPLASLNFLSHGLWTCRLTVIP